MHRNQSSATRRAALVLAAALGLGIVLAQVQPTMNKPAAKQTDPVCGMQVEVEKTTPRSVHKGKTYYFCSKNCKEDFDKNPANYTEKSKS